MGAVSIALEPMVDDLIKAHVLAAQRLHVDDTGPGFGEGEHQGPSSYGPRFATIGPFAVSIRQLPSRVRTHSHYSQKMTVAAMTMTDMKVWAQRS